MIETLWPFSSSALVEIARKKQAEYTILKLKTGPITPLEEPIQRWIEQARQQQAGWSYGYYHYVKDENPVLYPTIEYTQGSIRDDFDFGPLILVKTSLIEEFVLNEPVQYAYAGWYNLRLWLSEKTPPLHVHFSLANYHDPIERTSGQKQFDYVDPANRARQIEMEQVATRHLESIGALVAPPFRPIEPDHSLFEVEASVIIPVRNRVKTIAEAIQSVFNQKTTFPFNLIIIDNHSNDGTSELIGTIDDPRLIHILPSSRDLGIGGCWNLGVCHPSCGRYAVQLDSDDLYAGDDTLQRIVEKFYEGQYAMVIGSYRMVNFQLQEIPPGVIDHREWTDDNGPNNALRINGLGAPRAFFTPLIRQIGFPNVSYGEDYAVALAISRTYKIGRIYEPIYLCRRWDENTDSNLGVDTINAHNRYKDSLRHKEIEIRIKSKKSRQN